MRRMCRDWKNRRHLWNEQTKLNFVSILARWYDLIDIIKFIIESWTQSTQSVVSAQSAQSAQSIESMKSVESVELIESIFVESAQSIKSIQSTQSIKLNFIFIFIFIFIFYFREYRETIYNFVKKHREIEKSREYDREENILTWSTLYHDREWQYFFIINFRCSLKTLFLSDVDRMLKMKNVKCVDREILNVLIARLLVNVWRVSQWNIVI